MDLRHITQAIAALLKAVPPEGYAAAVVLFCATVLWLFARMKPAYSSGLAREVVLPKNSQVRQVVTGLPNGSTSVVPVEGNPSFGLDKGVASVPPITVSALFRKCAARCPDALALVSCEGRRYKWLEYVQLSEKVAQSLIALGLPADKGTINILGFNAPEWMLLNMGAILAGGIAAGVYTSNQKEACAYIAKHSKATVVGVENKEQLAKYIDSCDKEMPDLKAIVVWQAKSDKDLPDLGAQAPQRVKIFSWEGFLKLGESVSKDDLEKRIAKQKPNDPCTLIYTSGTTGNPKAVVITHDNATWTAHVVMGNLVGDDDMSNEPGGFRFVSYLPLSHIAAQMIDIHAPIFGTAYLEATVSVWYGDSNALRGTLQKTLTVAHPTHFFGVPRVWEKIQAAMVAKGKDSPALRKRIVAWARAQGLEAFRAMQNNGSGRMPLFWPVARRLLKAVRVALGLDRCRVCLTGAAPINVGVLDFFGSVNIPVLELYGMSECTGPTTLSHWGPGRGLLVGSCGRPMPGTELKIEHVKGRDPVGHGEICFRGRHIMPGYLYDEVKTKEAIDSEGWLHSGDVGVVDELGMLRITGRIKELLIGSGGENVPPVPIEEFLKSILPAVSNVVMIGDKRKFFVALVTAKCVANPDGTFADKLDNEAKLVDPACETATLASTSALWKAYFQKGLDVYNQEKAVSHAQKIQKFVILPGGDFSVPGGELGPTLKLKRDVVNKKYSKVIEELYAGTED